MKRITVKELIAFRNKSDRSKIRFALELKTRKPTEPLADGNGGGDHWITSTSCIHNVLKSRNRNDYDSKIQELKTRLQNTSIANTKLRHQRNIDILTRFKDFEFEDFIPNHDLTYQTISKQFKIVYIETYPIAVKPDFIYAYEQDGKSRIGSIWLVTKLNGFSKEEIGMFCEVLYRSLNKNYSGSYQLAEEYCVVIDTFSVRAVRYSDLSNGDVPFLIDGTLKKIKEL